MGYQQRTSPVLKLSDIFTHKLQHHARDLCLQHTKEGHVGVTMPRTSGHVLHVQLQAERRAAASKLQQATALPNHVSHVLLMFKPRLA